jgi:hypothetical protein
VRAIAANSNGNGHNGEDHGHGDEAERLVRLAFPAGASAKQRQALLNSALAARRAGVPLSFAAWAVVDPKNAVLTPFQRVDRAVEVARAAAENVNWAGNKHFTDLSHVATYLAGVGTGLPETVSIGCRPIPFRSILNRATTWPEGAEAAKGARP